ncbi:MAG: RNA-binding transcriptional accessory protein [Deltaproteobacteria bacterium]|nr:RNA-binding transcriptional accessory protein [Deltaproteobacteria bacterium]
MDLIAALAGELNLRAPQVQAALTLLDDANTIPFIARYRKEATGGLDEVQIRDVRDRAEYLRELEERRTAVLASIEEQGKLTPELRGKILAAHTKQELEDLYLPFRPKRRTRAQMAKEKGLEPLAHAIFQDNLPDAELDRQIAAFVAAYNQTGGPQPQGKPPVLAKDGKREDGLPASLTVEEAWAGCRDIQAEAVADDAATRQMVRQITWEQGVLSATAAPDFAQQVTKFSGYYDHSEALKKIPPHRYLALNRGEKEKVLRVRIRVEEGVLAARLQGMWAAQATGRPALEWNLALTDALERLIAPAVEIDVRLALKEASDNASIAMFGENLKHLLLAPPGGHRVVMGIDPGLRTGSKWVVVDKTGRLLELGTFYPLPPQKQEAAAAKVLAEQAAKHGVEVLVVGNGTGSREMMAFVRAVVSAHGLTARPLMVNESGASVYSASDLAREEFPDLDVTLRGAVSIARRYQDPLAELVKIDPKSIGVGQYQHDVNQTKLKRGLDETVESAVNHVGVNLNTASAPLLRYVSGIGPALAKSIVAHRDGHGPFPSRQALTQVPGLGPKSFQQCAGFLRIPGSPQPLDNSAVHPERYPVVEKMAQDLGVTLQELIANLDLISKIHPETYAEGELGLPTLHDILAELKKPGRDPREDHQTVAFDETVTDMEHLTPGMKLNGVVTNVTHFGAFVDIGVHQDGLVHVSQVADTYVKDPASVLKVGQPVVVRVVEVDLQRKRIALTMRSEEGEKKAGGKADGPSLGDGRGTGEMKKKSAGGKVPNHPAQPTLPVLPKGPLTKENLPNILDALNRKFQG